VKIVKHIVGRAGETPPRRYPVSDALVECEGLGRKSFHLQTSSSSVSASPYFFHWPPMKDKTSPLTCKLNLAENILESLYKVTVLIEMTVRLLRLSYIGQEASLGALP